MTPSRLEPAAPRFQVKHSTTEPLHSLKNINVIFKNEKGLKRIRQFGFKIKPASFQERLAISVSLSFTVCGIFKGTLV